MIATSDNWEGRRDKLPASDDPSASVAMLVEAGLPLGLGLRALSEEVPSPGLRHVLARMSDELASGESPEEVLTTRGRGLPRYIRGLIKAGVETGQLGSFLAEFLLILRRRAIPRQAFTLLLLVIFLLIVPALVVAARLVSSIILPFREMFESFGVELPAVTKLVLGLSELLSAPFLRWVISALVLLGLALLAIRYLVGPPTWTRAIQRIPLFGANSRMRALSEFSSLLGLLVSGHVPLPTALEITAGALRDANLKAGTRKLARRVAGGDSLDEAARSLPHFPAELQNLFRWENRGAAFGEILRQAGIVFASRSRVQLALLWLVVPPLLLIFVGGFIALTAIGLFMPLIKLLNELS